MEGMDYPDVYRIFTIPMKRYYEEEFKQLTEDAMALFEGRDPRDVIAHMYPKKAQLYGAAGQKL